MLLKTDSMFTETGFNTARITCEAPWTKLVWVFCEIFQPGQDTGGVGFTVELSDLAGLVGELWSGGMLVKYWSIDGLWSRGGGGGHQKQTNRLQNECYKCWQRTQQTGKLRSWAVRLSLERISPLLTYRACDFEFNEVPCEKGGLQIFTLTLDSRM